MASLFFQLKQLWLSLKVREPGCGRCGYPLQSWAGTMCPECGADREQVPPVEPFSKRYLILPAILLGWTVAILVLGIALLTLWGSIERIYAEEGHLDYDLTYPRLARWTENENTYVEMSFAYWTNDTRYFAPWVSRPKPVLPIQPDTVELRLSISRKVIVSLLWDSKKQQYTLAGIASGEASGGASGGVSGGEYQIIDSGADINIETMKQVIGIFGGKHSPEELDADATEMLRMFDEVVAGQGWQLNSVKSPKFGDSSFWGSSPAHYVSQKVWDSTWYGNVFFVAWALTWATGLFVVAKRTKKRIASMTRDQALD